jgi:hypothetical protein
MAANLFGNADLVWGLTAETGILVQSYEKAVSGSEVLAKDEEGETVGVSYYDPVADHSVEGHIASSPLSGAAAAEFGTALAIANESTYGGGVAAGDIICNNVTFRLENENYNMVTATARQWPGVVTA